MPFEFLRRLRSITESSGTAFIMDEVVTGFRVHPGGMQAVTVSGPTRHIWEVVGGGLPIGILGRQGEVHGCLDGGVALW
jgi:glutamate-1-semialdehyde aminotransferase